MDLCRVTLSFKRKTVGLLCFPSILSYSFFVSTITFFTLCHLIKYRLSIFQRSVDSRDCTINLQLIEFKRICFIKLGKIQSILPDVSINPPINKLHGSSSNQASQHSKGAQFVYNSVTIYRKCQFTYCRKHKLLLCLSLKTS